MSRNPVTWLGFAATPVFAMMAVLTSLLGADHADLMCGIASDAWPLGGMVPMYVLMSLFHCAPWLRLARGRRGRAVRA